MRRLPARATTAALSLVLVALGQPVLASATASRADAAAPEAAPEAAAVAAAPAAASTSRGPWTRTDERPGRTHGAVQRQVSPTAYQAYRLSPSLLAPALEAAPDLARRAPTSGTVVTVPSPRGHLVRFRVVEDSVLAPGLAAEYPGFTSYAGQAVDDPATSIRIDDSPLGFHASVRGPGGGDSDNGSWYVDPAFAGDDLYLSYDTADLPAPPAGAAPSAADSRDVPGAERAPISAAARPASDPGAAVTDRTYRLALLNDPTYAAYVETNVCPGLGSDECVAMAKAVLVNRVDQLYDDDLAIHLELVDGTDDLNLDTAAKAYGADQGCGAAACYTRAQLSACSGDTLTRNRVVLGQLLGADNFDIGHLALGTNGGGLADVGVVGQPLKAEGCTGIPDPVGDFYAVDYVAHEMGHQFDAEHTFNGVDGACAGNNRSYLNSVEPGSGSTVMGYAGICGDDDLQQHTDPYFSQRSQSQIGVYTASARRVRTEKQTVRLSGFAAGDSFVLTYDGQTSSRITSGSTYTASGISAAVKALVGDPVEVRSFDDTDSGVTAKGFTIAFDGARLDGTDVDPLGVRVTDKVVSGQARPATGGVGTLDQGGPADNQGYTVQTSANHNPVVTPETDRVIPLRTPFTLTGSGADADGDTLQYLWEQNDSAGFSGTALTSQTKRNGPLFRVFGTASTETDEDGASSPAPGENQATSDPSRTFPDLTQVLSGNTDASTGTCRAAAGPLRSCLSEWLPTKDYSPTAMHFRLTARDNRADGGGTAYANTTVTLDKSAGPLLVTSQPEGSNESTGSDGTVTWAVNNTAKSTLAPSVRISLSTDGGSTWQVLSASTPNDGSATVTWPAGLDTDTARVRVEAVGNVFFAVNSGDFTISDAPDTTLSGGPAQGALVVSRTASFTVGSNADPGSVTYQCSLDGAAYSTCPSPLTYDGLSSKTHTLEVRAVNAGTPDPTPATRTWAVPRSSDELRITKASWSRVSSRSGFDGRYLASRDPGATLTYDIYAKRLYLVVTRYRGSGSVDIYGNGRFLKTVYLSADRTDYLEPVLVANPGVPTAMKITVVNRGRAVVRVDGLGGPSR